MPPANAITRTNALGQSIWLDSISRDMIKSGELARMVEIGVSGVTSNPTIFEKAVSEGASYDEALAQFAQSGGDTRRIFEGLAVDDIRDAADVLRPVYIRTGAKDGYVSIEVSPKLAQDTAGTVEEARRLFKSIGRRNVMIKVPGTPEGVPAIRALIAEGININVTLLFSISAYRQSAEAYIAGLRDYVAAGRDSPEHIASVASFFVSRVDTAADRLLEKPPKRGPGIDPEQLKGKIGMANAKLAYAEFEKLFHGPFLWDLRKAEVQVQRPLWASTSTKNPKLPDTMYVDGLIGPDTVNTVPPATLMAFLEHGNPSDSLKKDVDEARRQVQQLGELGISLDGITDDLLVAGVKAFADSYDKLLKQIQDKLARLSAAPRAAVVQPAAPMLAAEAASGDRYSFGQAAGAVEAELTRVEKEHVVRRIWDKDETVWPLPSAASAKAKDRLGWLALPATVIERGAEMASFAEQMRSEGFDHTVLMGIGGAAAAAEAIRDVLAPSYALTVLDTVEPETVRTRLNTVQGRNGASLRRTLFIVASKSGTTIEVVELERACRQMLADHGVRDASRQFVAITDQGTPLRARAAEFRWVFSAPSDVGGRFSGLSEFGLLPAALMGVDLRNAAAASARMAEMCRAPVAQNPGVRLGVSLAALAKSGRDKATVIAPPALGTFARWAEQMLAESLGKSGRGVVPVVGEPLYDAAAYGADRFFVHVRMEGGAAKQEDALADRLEASGAPLVRISLKDKYWLPAEFFRWEFATAVAGNCLGVYPFDEPEVASAKASASEALKRGWAAAVPEPGLAHSLEQMLKQRRARDYVAVLAYVPESEEFARAVAGLREGITGRTGLATTFGYGPRYLHSSGQLHKGGPDSCMALVLVTDAVPGRDGKAQHMARLLRAQASGDVQALRDRGVRVAYVSLGVREIGANAVTEVAAAVEAWRI